MNYLKSKRSLFLNKKAILYVFFKYIELIVTASVMLILAKNIGPTEMGYSISYLLYITYSSYLGAGTNAMVIKQFFRQPEKIIFVSNSLKFILIVCILNFFLSYLFFDNFFLISLISISLLLKNFFYSYFRSIFKTIYINIVNIYTASFLLLGTLFYVENWNDYLLIWMFAISSSVIICLFLETSIIKLIFPEIIKKSIFTGFHIDFKEVLYLTCIGIIGTVFLTTDRLIINNLDISDSIKGSYQFADNITTAFFMGFGSLIFYFTPNIIEKVNQDKKFFFKFSNYTKYLLFIIPSICALSYLFSNYVFNLWFTEYKGVALFICTTLFLKLTILSGSIYALIFNGLDAESSYLRLSIIPILLLFINFILVKIYLPIELITFIPLSISLIVFIFIIIQNKMITKIIKKQE